MNNLKTIVLGTVILTIIFALNSNIAYAQRRQCNPSKEECPGRKMQQKVKLASEHRLQTNITLR